MIDIYIPPYYIECHHYIDDNDFRVELAAYKEAEYLILVRDYKNNMYALYKIASIDVDWTKENPFDARNIVYNFDYLILEEAQKILPTYKFTEQNYGIKV